MFSSMLELDVTLQARQVSSTEVNLLELAFLSYEKFTAEAAQLL